MTKTKAEYIWLDGHRPTQKLRSKTKVINGSIEKVENLPSWGFDGSSTNQADGEDSDCMLKPVYMVPDPIRGDNSLLVMCEVLNADGTVHASNTRSKLARLIKNSRRRGLVWYRARVYFEGRSPLGWPEGAIQRHKAHFIVG